MSAQDAQAANQQLLDKVYALAFEYEQKHGNCPQCVLAALQSIFGFIDDQTFKAAHALAGGSALAGEGTCGALSGGMLAIASQYGRDRAHFAGGRSAESYKLSKKLYDQFVAEFGSPICRAVQTKIIGRGFDLWNPSDYKAFEEAGGHRDKCPNVVGKAAMWTAAVLLEAASNEA